MRFALALACAALLGGCRSDGCERHFDSAEEGALYAYLEALDRLHALPADASPEARADAMELVKLTADVLEDVEN